METCCCLYHYDETPAPDPGLNLYNQRLTFGRDD